MASGSLIARFTPEEMTGLPWKRPRSFTPMSVAKMIASAASICAGSNGVVADDPCVSTASSTPARSAAYLSASAAM